MTFAPPEVPKFPHARFSVLLPLQNLPGFLKMTSTCAGTFPCSNLLFMIPAGWDETVEVTIDITTADTTAGEIAYLLQVFLQAQNRTRSLNVDVGPIQYLGGTEV